MVRSIQEVYKSWFTRALVTAMKFIEDNWLSRGAIGSAFGLGEKTGDLKRSLHGEVIENGFLISTEEPQGAYWELGTRARTIYAAPGSVLPMHLKSGELRFARKVVVPAQPARKWLQPGLIQVMPQLMEIGNQLTSEWLKEKFPDRTVRM